MRTKIITKEVLQGESISHEDYPDMNHLLVLKGHMAIIDNGRIITHIRDAEIYSLKEKSKYTATAVRNSEVIIF